MALDKQTNDDVLHITQAVEHGWDDPDAESYLLGGSAADTPDEPRFLVTWGQMARDWMDGHINYPDRGLRTEGPGWDDPNGTASAADGDR